MSSAAPTISQVLTLLGAIANECALFPIWAVVDGKCSCGQHTCDKGGKHPACWWGNVSAGEKLTRQFNGQEPTSYGICTGSRSGNIFVIDCDVKPKQGIDGVAEWTRLCAKQPTPRTRVHATPSGGRHFFFRAPAGFVVPTLGTDERTRFAAGIDVRGERGGFVVAPGCPHKNGGVYTVEQDVPVADAPTWLLNELALRRETSSGSHAGIVAGANAPMAVPIDSELGQFIADAAIRLCETAPPAIDGAGGSVATLKVASRLVRKWCMSPDDALEVMLAVYNPRCEPPWTEAELVHKIESALNNPSFIHEEFPDAYMEHLERKRHAKEIAAAAPLATARPRKCRNPSWVPSFVPGVNTTGMSREAVAKPLTDVVSMLATHPAWDGCLQYDEFRGRAFAVDPPLAMDAQKEAGLSDADCFGVRMWMECHGVLLQKGETYDAIQTAARYRRYHPIKEYLESCRAKRRPGILDDLAAWVFGAADPLSQELLKKTLVAAVRRIYHPGTRVDTVLVLMGKQGAKKTTFVQTLFGDEYVRSQMPDLSNKDSSAALNDFWCVELGELHKTLKSDHGTVKEFLSRRYDDYIPRYGRCDVRVPRHTIFVGTVNEDTFLADATGNRRFWPIAVHKVDIAYVRKHRDAIWAEALALAEDPTFEHWFEDESLVEPAHEAFIVQDPWHNLVREYLIGRARVTCEEVFKSAICGSIPDMTKFTKAAQMSITDTLKRLGCARKKSNGAVVWGVPADLAGEVPPNLSRSEQLKRDLG